MASLGRRLFPMFSMAVIAIVVASGASFASRQTDDSAPNPISAYDAGYLPSIESDEREIETLADARNLPARCEPTQSFCPHIASPR